MGVVNLSKPRMSQGLRCMSRWTSVAKVALFPVLALMLCPSANAQPARNLAYDDGFVWYLSGRLAADLTESQKRSGIKLEESDWASQRQQFEILYRRYLVECHGPLSQLAEILRFFDPSATSSREGYQTLAYVGLMEHEIWPVIRGWQSKILLPLMDTYASGKYDFYPECVVPGYRSQNPSTEQK
jgi:hypothetical protein